MEVLVADAAGFCMGVKRACQMAFEAADSRPDGVRSLGPIIHNPQLVRRLAERGLGVVDSIDEVPAGSAVLIRSHGVPPEVYRRAAELELEVIDATCPLVRKAHRLTESLAAEGYRVVIVGEPDHPEVRALSAYAGLGARVVQTVEDVRALDSAPRIGVVAQTTQLLGDYARLVGELLAKADELKVFNTICNATALRQQAVEKLAELVDAIVIVGGKNSANTTRLYQRCRDKLGLPARHIETADELRPEWFTGMTRLGVTAGASTPDWIIDEVVQRLRDM